MKKLSGSIFALLVLLIVLIVSGCSPAPVSEPPVTVEPAPGTTEPVTAVPPLGTIESYLDVMCGTEACAFVDIYIPGEIAQGFAQFVVDTYFGGNADLYENFIRAYVAADVPLGLGETTFSQELAREGAGLDNICLPEGAGAVVILPAQQGGEPCDAYLIAYGADVDSLQPIVDRYGMETIRANHYNGVSALLPATAEATLEAAIAATVAQR